MKFLSWPRHEKGVATSPNILARSLDTAPDSYVFALR